MGFCILNNILGKPFNSNELKNKILLIVNAKTVVIVEYPIVFLVAIEKTSDNSKIDKIIQLIEFVFCFTIVQILVIKIVLIFRYDYFFKFSQHFVIYFHFPYLKY